MKPILVIPPAPAHWPALLDLLRHKGPPWVRDMERRMVEGVPGAQDVYAVIRSGGQFLANACVNKFGDVGVLGHCFTRPDHRRRGYARQLVEAVLSWFEMMGGQRLILGTTAELDETLYRKFGFTPLRRAIWAPYDRLTMQRLGRGVADDAYVDIAGDVEVRELTRAAWPAMVALLQFRPGPDPRVPLDESAVTAEAFGLDLIEHQERGACCLLGAYRGPRLIGLATVATDRPRDRTYGMLIPHVDAPPELRTAALEFARGEGYAQVDFPMEGLGRMVGAGLVDVSPAVAPGAPPADEPPPVA